jgi:hypothetical protein
VVPSKAHPEEEPVPCVHCILLKSKRAACLAEAQINAKLGSKGGVLHGVKKNPQTVGGFPGDEDMAMEEVESGKMHLYAIPF